LKKEAIIKKRIKEEKSLSLLTKIKKEEEIMEKKKSKFLPLKRCIQFRRKDLIWIGVVATIALYLSSASYAEEPLSISHALVGYTCDGPTVTLDFSLDIENNGTVTLSDAEISIAPIGPADRLLEPIPEESPLYIGDIPADGNISIDYTIQSILVLSEEEIKDFPLFWEIEYTDETGQAQLILVESQPASTL